MDFITIAFETANYQRSSVCEIGLTFVSSGVITETMTWLIRPFGNQFDYFNTLIHGINDDDVVDSPDFQAVWHEILPLIETQFLISHNAGYAFSVLRQALQVDGLSFPDLDYACSYIFSKKIWGGLASYDLPSLCDHNKIELLRHRAGPNSIATAQLAILAFEKFGVTSKDNFTEILKTTIGRLYPNGYKPSESKRVREYKSPTSIIGDPVKVNIESIFYGQSVVFTGTLSSMTRAQAQQRIADIGGNIGNVVTKDTCFLVIGQQDFRIVGDDGMSKKQEKAIRLIESGSSLEVVSESEFLNHL